MEKIFQDMKTLYAARRRSGIDAFMAEWIAPECVIMGTALGELALTPADVRNLFDGDLRYWDVDVSSAVREEIDHVSYLTCNAEVSYNILENEKRYESYISWCAEIAKDPLASPAVKGAQIAFILDTLLSSRKNKRRKNCLPLTIRVLLREERAVFMQFAFDKTIDTADHYMGDGADTAKSYADERAMLCGDGLPGVASFLHDHGYEDAAVSCRGDIFFGVALQQRAETLDEAMAAVLSGDRQEDAYRTLFDLRLRIAFLQKVYAIEAHPRAVVRFFGFVQAGGVALFVPSYPLDAYMEWK